MRIAKTTRARQRITDAMLPRADNGAVSTCLTQFGTRGGIFLSLSSIRATYNPATHNHQRPVDGSGGGWGITSAVTPPSPLANVQHCCTGSARGARSAVRRGNKRKKKYTRPTAGILVDFQWIIRRHMYYAGGSHDAASLYVSASASVYPSAISHQNRTNTLANTLRTTNSRGTTAKLTRYEGSQGL